QTPVQRPSPQIRLLSTSRPNIGVSMTARQSIHGSHRLDCMAGTLGTLTRNIGGSRAEPCERGGKLGQQLLTLQRLVTDTIGRPGEVDGAQQIEIRESFARRC